MSYQPVSESEIPKVLAAMRAGRCVACYGEIDRACPAAHELYCCDDDDDDECEGQ